MFSLTDFKISCNAVDALVSIWYDTLCGDSGSDKFLGGKIELLPAIAGIGHGAVQVTMGVT